MTGDVAFLLIFSHLCFPAFPLEDLPDTNGAGFLARGQPIACCCLCKPIVIHIPRLLHVPELGPRSER
jgi:hypothetical protein